jgi:hypothetical protein
MYINFFITGLTYGLPSHGESEQSFGYDSGELGKNENS